MTDHDFMKPVYEGDCAECGGVIRLNQGAVRTFRGYIHGTCQEKTTTRLDERVVNNQIVCTRCFLTKPCECD